jgi:hypothetical protein
MADRVDQGGEAKEVMACWCGYVRGDQSTRKECPHKHGRLKKARIVFISCPAESRDQEYSPELATTSEGRLAMAAMALRQK